MPQNTNITQYLIQLFRFIKDNDIQSQFDANCKKYPQSYDYDLKW